ncbi:hypothetical protein [Undibacterium sp. Di24W]|uniref:hypothetical protein n=1 Tax=Undibacterium sp. Di24W TaxID=3413033 RepID=UPI003BF41781
MQEKEPEKRIKFDATINLGHVLTFLGFIGTIGSFWQSVDKRIVVLEQARVVQSETDHRHDAERAEIKKTMREDLREINAKLDRLIEKR